MKSKKFEKKLIVMLAMVMLLTIMTVSFATTHHSSLTIGGNSTLTGDWRSYDAGTMKIGIKFDSLYVPTSSNYMTVDLDKKNIIGYTTIGSITNAYPKSIQINSNYGSQSADSYRFYFNTLGYSTSGGYASYVIMGNY